ncbi:MAG TPA: FAD-dependent oxidoreductase, partial [Casimicrobiaceae bacterium]|nr:FAD-dependent oxidoreductase [Casimicrobiaceae bacterium]
MITPDLLSAIPLFAGIDESELEEIAAHAADVHLRAGDFLIQEGEAPAFFMVLSGKLAVTKEVAGHERELTTYSAGDFAGEVPLLLGSPAIASLRALEPTRVARLAAHDFHALFSECQELNGKIMSAMTTRLRRLQNLQTATPRELLTLTGHQYDLACHGLRDFLARNHVPFRFRDIREVLQSGTAPKSDEAFPQLEFPDGSRLVTPTLRAVAEKLGLQTSPANVRYDVAIVGAGPAGLAAAVYGASEGLRTVLIEREAPGGQAGTSSRIENYLGFPTGIAGDDLGTRALQQAKRFGAEILVARDVSGIANGNGCHAVILDGGERVETRAVIIATGVAWRQLEAPGAERFIGRGLYYGAARTEAPATRGRDIYLIGGGNSAGQAAMFFAGFARSVTLVVRGPSLAASMSHYLIQQLGTQANVRIETHAQVVGVDGDSHLEAIDIEDRRTGARRRVATDAVFVFIGADAET